MRWKLRRKVCSCCFVFPIRRALFPINNSMNRKTRVISPKVFQVIFQTVYISCNRSIIQLVKCDDSFCCKSLPNAKRSWDKAKQKRIHKFVRTTNIGLHSVPHSWLRKISSSISVFILNQSWISASTLFSVSIMDASVANNGKTNEIPITITDGEI